MIGLHTSVLSPPCLPQNLRAGLYLSAGCSGVLYLAWEGELQAAALRLQATKARPSPGPGGEGETALSSRPFPLPPGRFISRRYSEGVQVIIIITSTGSGGPEPPPTRSGDPRSSSNSEEFVALSVSLSLSATGRLLLPAQSNRRIGSLLRRSGLSRIISNLRQSLLYFSPLPPTARCPSRPGPSRSAQAAILPRGTPDNPAESPRSGVVASSPHFKKKRRRRAGGKRRGETGGGRLLWRREGCHGNEENRGRRGKV